MQHFKTVVIERKMHVQLEDMWVFVNRDRKKTVGPYSVNWVWLSLGSKSIGKIATFGLSLFLESRYNSNGAHQKAFKNLYLRVYPLMDVMQPVVTAVLLTNNHWKLVQLANFGTFDIPSFNGKKQNLRRRKLKWFQKWIHLIGMPMDVI